MRRLYKYCDQCKRLVLVAGVAQKGDFIDCTHRFSRAPRTPTVIYVNAEGDVWNGPDAETKCPIAGYERREIQPHELPKFEREMNDYYKRLHAEARYEPPEQTAARERVRKELREEVIRESQGWDREHREFLDYALNQAPVEYTRNYDPGFRVGD